MKKLYSFLVFTLTCIFSLLFGEGWGGVVFSQEYSFRHFTIADGLGGNSINHIFQDNKGYVWFATQGGGVSRFNGREFKTYTKADGLINNDVTYIAEDARHNIWIATASGVSRFDGSKFTNYNLTNGVVYCIFPDSDKIWFATADSGIMVMEKEGRAAVLSPSCFRRGAGGGNREEDAGGGAYTIAKDKQNSLWFGLSNGIAQYANGKITSYANNLLIGNRTFFCSLTDNNGNVWFGAASGEVAMITPNGNYPKIEMPFNFKGEFIGGIAEDKKGNLWLASDKGLIKCEAAVLSPSCFRRRAGGGNREEMAGGDNNKQGVVFTDQNGLSVSTIQTVLCDYEGNIWAGTLAGGVNLLTSEAFVHYTSKSGLASQNVTCMARGKQNNRCIGTSNGLYTFSPNEKSPFKKVSGINANIASLCIDDKERLWAAAQDEVIVFDKQLRIIKTYSQIDGTKLVSPSKIICAKNGTIWIATYGSGLFSINASDEKHYNDTALSNNILTVYEDRANNLWLGTYDKGLLKYDGLHFTPSYFRRGQREVSIWNITEDNNTNLCLATGEHGIYRFNEKTAAYFNTQNGFSSNHITSLAWDSANQCLWAASEKSLDKIIFAEKAISVRSYKTSDGFSSAGVNQSGLFAEDGSLWICGTDGLWLYNRKLDANKNIAPKIQLTGVRLFYQPISSLINTFAYNKNHLTFDIQALTTQEVLYKFKLEGQDDDWSLPQKNNAITYTNIAPGHYTFIAKAVTALGIESKDAVTFSFIVNPPWWATWWFRSLAAIAIISSLVIFIKARERALREQNVKLETTVKQRTQVIEQQKQTVEKMLSEKEVLLKEIHHRVKNNLQTISSMLMLQSAGLKDEQAKKAISESQSRVQSIALVHQKLYQTDGLEKVELNAFMQSLTEQVKLLYQSKTKNISVEINIPETFVLIDKAIPLGLILNELLTNSFKYAFNNSEKGEIKISLAEDKSDTASKSRKVRLCYFDSGAGFSYNELAQKSSSLGVRLIRLLSQQIGSTVEYSNTNGSEFIFTFGINI